MPAFNAEPFLLEAARSVLSQTVRELQLVIVDDGSTDATLAAARSIADPRVLVLTGPNRGRAHARNRGLAAAAPSETVAYLDADDAWDPDKLEVQLAYLAAHPDAVAVGSLMRYISSTGVVLGETGQRITSDDLRRIARGELSPFPISSSVLVRRPVVDAIGGFDELLREAEDLEFLAQVARRGAVGCVARVLGSYRIHPMSAMALHRYQVNAYARFVRARLAARDAGGDLEWDAFVAAYRLPWRERRRDFAEFSYRSAALWHGERRPLRALAYGLLAGLAAPAYTLRRLYRQRLAAVLQRRGA